MCSKHTWTWKHLVTSTLVLGLHQTFISKTLPFTDDSTTIASSYMHKRAGTNFTTSNQRLRCQPFGLRSLQCIGKSQPHSPMGNFHVNLCFSGRLSPQSLLLIRTLPVSQPNSILFGSHLCEPNATHNRPTVTDCVHTSADQDRFGSGTRGALGYWCEPRLFYNPLLKTQEAWNGVKAQNETHQVSGWNIDISKLQYGSTY